MYDDFTISDKPTDIALPDPREKELEKQLTKQELDLLNKEKKLLLEMANELKKNLGKSEFNIQTFMQTAQDKHSKFFSESEKGILQNAKEKSKIILLGGDSADTSEIDKKITDNINTVFNPQKNIQLTMYGAAHFTKENDLNERMDGLSIAIANSEKNMPVQLIFTSTETRNTHYQFPDYVYYANEKRLVKMDNEAAKADFLGLTEEQFNAYKVARHMDKEKRFIAPLEMYDTKTIEAPPPIEFRKPSPQNRHNQPSDRGV